MSNTLISDSAQFNNLLITGSINLSGSFMIQDQTFAEKVSTITPYGLVEFKSSENDTWDLFGGYFTFRMDSSSYWTGSKTTRLQLPYFNYPTNEGSFKNPNYPNNIWTISEDARFGNWGQYFVKFLDFFNGENDFNKTIISLRSNRYPDTQKKFKIKNIKSYSPLFSSQSSGQGTDWFLSSKVLLSEPILQKTPFIPQNVQIINDTNFVENKYTVFGGLVGYPIQDNNLVEYLNILDSSQTAELNEYVDATDGILKTFGFVTQYDLEVEELYSSIDENDPAFFDSPNTIPMDGDLFWVDFEKVTERKRKTIEFVTSSKNVTIPDWADKITLICVGAGGGGGGGASGYPHTESIEYKLEDPISISTFLESGGDCGEYSASLTTPFGHEVVTGGGGGAGGCIAIKYLNENLVVPSRGSNLNITIGSGGEGGKGSSYFDDIFVSDVQKTGINCTGQIDGWNTLLEVSDAKFKHKNEFPRIDDGYSITSPSSWEYNGKPGSDTFIHLNNDMLVCAQGGNGGSGGFALRNYFDAFHMLCGIVKHQSSNFTVPGGSNDGNTNFGDEIRIGAPGGYGISMPTAIQFDRLDWTTKGIQRTYPTKYNVSTLNKNLAPNIPDSWGSNRLNLPFGNNFRDSSNPFLFLKYKSDGFIVSDKPAPTGGGGGCGVSFNGIDRRPISTYSNIQSVDPDKNIIEWNGHNLGFQNDTVPNDYFQKWSDFVQESIILGLGGINNDSGYLLDDTDENGVNWKFPELGWNNYRGGNGGYGKYGIEADNKLHTNGIAFLNTQPTTGTYYGFGGGGGAARFVLNHSDKYNQSNESTYPTTGQDGANGANGIAIVIIESLV